MKKRIVIIASVVIAVLCVVLLSSCSNSNETFTETTEAKSFEEQMDIAMQNAGDNTVLASVNGVEITQVDMDLYSIGGEKHTIDELIKYCITADYAEKNSLKLSNWYQKLYDDVKTEMLNDEELSEKYCLENYGITKNEVIEYAQKRVYQIGMNAAFFDLLLNDIDSGSIVEKYPELKKAYKKFEKDKLSKGSKAWDDIENAYYEMIAQDYEIVIY